MPNSRKPIVAFLHLEKEQSAQLDKLLRAASRDLGARVAQAGTSRSATITRLQARAQQEAIKSYLEGSFGSIRELIAAGQQEAARRASRVVSEEFGQLLGKYISADDLETILASEAQRAANGVVAAMRRMDSSYMPLSGRVYRTRALANGQVNDIINKALIKGDSWAQLARDIRSSINPDVPGGVSYAAKRLARTEINNAFHATSVAKYQQAKFVDGVDWNLSSSHPEGDECDGLAHDGPYPVNSVPSKPHPQCFCYVTAALPEPDDFLNNLLAGNYDEPGEFDDTPVNKAIGQISNEDKLRNAATMYGKNSAKYRAAVKKFGP